MTSSTVVETCEKEEEPAFPEDEVVKVLPSELWVASFASLSFSTLLSLQKSCRFFRDLLDRHWNKLAKYNITTISIDREYAKQLGTQVMPVSGDGELVFHVSRSSFNAVRRNWMCHMMRAGSDAAASRKEVLREYSEALGEEEASVDLDGENFPVEQFYRTHGFSGLKWDTAKRCTRFLCEDDTKTLASHLDFLLHKANPTSLRLLNPSEKDLDAVSSVLRRHLTRCDHLIAIFNHHAVEHDSLLKCVQASNADSINISLYGEMTLDSSFFSLPNVLRAWSIAVCSDSPLARVALSDDALVEMAADSMDMTARTQVTMNGINRLIKKWQSGGRNIVEIAIHMDEKDAMDPNVLCAGLETSRSDDGVFYELHADESRLLRIKINKDNNSIGITTDGQFGDDDNDDSDEIV